MYRGNRPRQYLHCRKRDLDGVQVPNNAGPHTYNYRPNLLLKVIYFQSFTKAPTLEIFKYVRSKQPTWLNMSTIKVCTQENSLFKAIFREVFFFFFLNIVYHIFKEIYCSFDNSSPTHFKNSFQILMQIHICIIPFKFKN